jgi:hypothetical protein
MPRHRWLPVALILLQATYGFTSLAASSPNSLCRFKLPLTEYSAPSNSAFRTIFGLKYAKIHSTILSTPTSIPSPEPLGFIAKRSQASYDLPYWLATASPHIFCSTIGLTLYHAGPTKL